MKDGEPLGRLLALLGQSRIANNLNQLAKAANQGALPVTVEVEADLRAACAEVFEMRLLLLRALGIKILDEVKDRTSLPEVFSDAARASEQ
ncbi:plasmid mobilization relaxosome protein MobC [Pseudorhodoplanes sp.]|uniref:plasmid mobilization relaxosome protein MobC n=1 Tax=Pseudorhodoplanes sp. TaxID=1934341 RepID=UPI003D0DC2D1